MSEIQHAELFDLDAEEVPFEDEVLQSTRSSSTWSFCSTTWNHGE
ncbi:hypothetical protein ACFV8Z_52920 [Streptomyces sp. NPDC059837]|jgi:hypothetical protein|nr:hypothetical protein [Streptomyces sp. NBC_00268]KPI21446.1 hypothetical protein OK006_9287 [Actinobacteria bacterium OK006]MCX5191290.1 hypothetical protein [Streptomyces sp. NBC_00268]